DRIAVVVEPIDERANGGIFLILDHRCVIKRAQQITARLEFLQQFLVVDVEPERLGGGVEIGAVNKQSNFLTRYGHVCVSRSLEMKSEIQRATGPRAKA